LDQVRAIELPQFHDARGKLTILESELPFTLRRCFFLHDLPPGSERGGHAHRATEQFFLALHGSFRLDLRDSTGTRTFRLDSPGKGYYVPPMLWDRLYDFAEGAICMVAASTRFDEADYIRDWAEFERLSALVEGARSGPNP
jgi:hypothetical protein